MGIYENRILPRFIDRVLSRPECLDLRERVSSRLSGEVVELGFGSGLNVPYYPQGVTRVQAIEPCVSARNMAAGRVANSHVSVEFSGLDGQKLALENDSVDSVLSTWTLCTIPDLSKALGEVMRILKPGGSFHFLEHGQAPEQDSGVRRWQDRLTPLSRALGGGCHMNRPIFDLIKSANFSIDESDSYYMPGPKIGSFMYEGVASKPPSNG